MDVLIRTGATKAPRDTTLGSLSLITHQKEQVCLLMEISAKAKDARTVEKECEHIIQHSLVETDGDPSQRLDGTLKELNGLLKGLIVSGAIDDAHMLVAILDKQHLLHVSHAGRAEVYLIRKGLASQITEYTSGKPIPAFVHIASGQLEKRDAVILSTQRLLRTLTPAQLTQVSQREQSALDMLGKRLETEGEHGALATIFVGHEEMEEVDDVPVRGSGRMGNLRDRRALRHESRSSGALASFMDTVQHFIPSMDQLKSFSSSSGKLMRRGASAASSMSSKASLPSVKLPNLAFLGTAQEKFQTFLADLTHPKRKRRAHLCLLYTSPSPRD